MRHDSAPVASPKGGKPAKAAAALAARVPGMVRPNVEVDLSTLKEIDREALAHDRSRAAEIRVLLAEALALRGAAKQGDSRKVQKR